MSKLQITVTQKSTVDSIESDLQSAWGEGVETDTGVPVVSAQPGYATLPSSAQVATRAFFKAMAASLVKRISAGGGGGGGGSTAASAVTVVPSGNLASTDVQSALVELQTDIDTRATSSALSAHTGASSGAHAASAISVSPAGNQSSSDVQAAIDELQTDIDARATASALATTNSTVSSLSSSLSAHTGASSGAHAASAISVAPSGNLGSTDAQSALVELQTDIDTRATSAALTAHTGATSGAHAASAISTASHNTWTAGTVQSTLNAIEDQVDTNTSNIATNTSSISSVSSSLSAHTGASSGIHGVTGSVVGTSDTQVLTNKSFSDTVQGSIFRGYGAASAFLKGAVVDGASAVGVVLDNTNDLTTAGAKIVSIRRATTEKAFFDKDGALNITGVASGSAAIQLTAGQRIYVSSNANEYIASAGSGILTVPNGFQVQGTLQANFVITSSNSGGLMIRNSSAGNLAIDYVYINTTNALSNASGRIFALLNGGTKKISWDINGKTFYDTTDSSGTPGDATINKPSGSVSIASGASSVTITNSLVTLSSVVTCCIAGAADDTTVKNIRWRVASGSIVVTGTDAAGTPTNATGNVRVNFIVNN